jgi:hypothetical protein
MSKPWREISRGRTHAGDEARAPQRRSEEAGGEGDLCECVRDGGRGAHKLVAAARPRRLPAAVAVELDAQAPPPSEEVDHGMGHLVQAGGLGQRVRGRAYEDEEEEDHVREAGDGYVELGLVARGWASQLWSVLSGWGT